jgi:hypothetical protein
VLFGNHVMVEVNGIEFTEKIKMNLRREKGRM